LTKSWIKPLARTFSFALDRSLVAICFTPVVVGFAIYSTYRVNHSRTNTERFLQARTISFTSYLCILARGLTTIGVGHTISSTNGGKYLRTDAALILSTTGSSSVWNIGVMNTGKTRLAISS